MNESITKKTANVETDKEAKEITELGSTVDIQKRIYKNKITRGFNVIDIPMEFCFMYGEVSEAFDAWKRGTRLDLELADVAIYLFEVAEITGIDLGKAIDKKMADNEYRTNEIGSQEWYDNLDTQMKDYFADGMK